MRLFVFILIAFYINIFAKDIDINSAKNIAKSWIKNIENRDINIIDNNRYSFISRREISNEPYYIFNFKGGGWIIVSDNDINSNVLAYSNNGYLDKNNLPPQFKWWLSEISKELKKSKKLLKNKKNISLVKTPALRLTSAQNKSVGPLLRTNWGQGRGYNEYTPRDSRSIEGNGHVPTGCVATAMAQVMNYFAWPPRGIGSNSYIPASHPEYGRLSVDFGKTSYSWSSLEKARNIYHAGVAVNMNYGPYNSSAYLSSANSALRRNFRYTTSGIVQRQNDDEWIYKLVQSLDRGSPILYQGKGNIVHVFVCDGYKRVNDGYLFHFNWGWGGRANGWFRIGGITPLNNYSFNYKNYAIFDIYPNDPAYKTGVRRVGASLNFILYIFLFFALGFLKLKRF